MDKIKKLCADRKQSPFEINTELRVRKWLTSVMDSDWEITKNENALGVDLVCKKFFQNGDDCVKTTIGFVEVEVSEKWENEFPPHWRNYSFLRRKVQEFNWDTHCWSNLLEYAEKTVYVIFNKSMTDAYCINAATAVNGRENSRVQYANERSRKYNADVFEFNLSSAHVVRGLSNVSFFIHNFLESESQRVAKC